MSMIVSTRHFLILVPARTGGQGEHPDGSSGQGSQFRAYYPADPENFSPGIPDYRNFIPPAFRDAFLEEYFLELLASAAQPELPDSLAGAPAAGAERQGELIQVE